MDLYLSEWLLLTIQFLQRQTERSFCELFMKLDAQNVFGHWYLDIHRSDNGSDC